MAAEWGAGCAGLIIGPAILGIVVLGLWSVLFPEPCDSRYQSAPKGSERYQVYYTQCVDPLTGMTGEQWDKHRNEMEAERQDKIDERNKLKQYESRPR